MSQGWIKLHRSILDTMVATNNDYFGLFVRLLLLANHKEKTFLHGNQKVTLKRGQILTGRKQLSKETGLNESKLQRLLKTLQKCHAIEQQTNNRYRVITIVNYDSYFESEQQMNNKRTTNEQQMNTNKNVKNVKNVKKDTGGSAPKVSDFKKKEDLFYEGYNQIRKLFIPNSRGIHARDKKTRKQLKERLAEGYTIQDIGKAIQNMFLDDWHKKNNYKHSTPEFITRADKLQRFSMLEVQQQEPKYLNF